LSSKRKPAIFLSYTRNDDEYEGGALSALRQRLEDALRFASGEPLDIFQDVEDIKFGQDIRQRIEKSLAETMVFVPIITPSYLKSRWCREELERFLKREQQLGRRDLILPIYYQRVPALERARQGPRAASTATDALVRELAPRLSVDWRDLRRKEPESREVRMAVERIAERILEVLEELEQATPPAPEPEPEPEPKPEPEPEPPRSAELLRTLRDPQQPTAARIQAGFALGRQGDPRFPVRLDEWREELGRLRQGLRDSYFCYVPEGRYIIGSNDKYPDARDNEKPWSSFIQGTPFLIARYPITNAQWQEWVRAGGTPSHYADNEEYNQPNQPVVGVSWEECRDFCYWISQVLRMFIHLPTEAEWEAAARGIGFRGWRYTWGNEWHNDRAASWEDRETRGTQATVPVGCYPLGAAPCGALDMLGNVWEWTASPWTDNHARRQSMVLADNATQFTVKGGGFRTRRSMIRCAARAPASRDARDPDLGFRVVVWPKKVVSPVSSQSYSKER
jgi:formylglycine-generating enzyme required for sulfatase activity